MAWNDNGLEPEHQHLFQHFQSTSYKALAIFGHRSVELGALLIRLALSGTSTSATAVFQALLALASLSIYDVCVQAVELKVSALRALTAACGDYSGTAEAVRQVAAGMLLMSFEIHRASCTSGEWTCHLQGVKNIIQSSHLHDRSRDSDVALLLDWVYYHDVLARFTKRHWLKANDEEACSSSSSGSASPSISGALSVDIHPIKPSQNPHPALATITLLYDVSNTVSAQRTGLASNQDVREHKSFVKILDWRIRSTPLECESADALLFEELHQLALLIYLNQASGHLLNQAARTQQQIQRGFDIIKNLQSCERQFPVFIFGCEARSDEQRASLLDLIARTEKLVSSRSFNYVRRIVQAIWVQDDLADQGLAYWDKLTNVVSCCTNMPSFV